MSQFSHVLWFPDGEQFHTYPTRRWPIGTKLELQDGRVFRFGKINTTAPVAAGYLVQSEVPAANFDDLQFNTAITPLPVLYERKIWLTNKNVAAITANMFAGGYLSIHKTPGMGMLYKIEANDAAAATGSPRFSVTLVGGEGLQAVPTSASRVLLSKHHLYDVILTPAPATAAVVGVAATLIPIAAPWGWFQVEGEAAVVTDGTVTIGTPVKPGSVAGTVAAVGATEAAVNAVGVVAEVGAGGDTSIIKLEIE